MRDGKPYVVFATAPSMNGYASANAAITVDGHKKTLPGRAPLGVFMDLAVLANAPARLIRAGLGDALCRPTAQADWLLSHLLLGTPYRSAPFALLAADEPALLREPEALVAGDLDAMRALARTLLLSGFGMTLCGGSHPASEGEHLISHYVDMFAPAERAPHFHGEQVAVATLTMARLQEAVLADDVPVWRPRAVTAATLHERFGAEIGESCWHEFAAKQAACARPPGVGERLATQWGEIRQRVERVVVPSVTIAAAMQRAGCPITPADIGVSPGFYASTVRNARFLRDRYTFLDLADDSGRLADLWPG
jgi:glycerol-1-phosphate dehydrogenase [NAD(P)+]